MAVSRGAVDAHARTSFPEGDVAGILAILDGYGTQHWEPERERVQLAILTLAKGDLGKLRHFTDAAKKDYRDVLMWAEYPSTPEQAKVDRAAVGEILRTLGPRKK